MVNGDNEHFFFSVLLKQDTGKYIRVKKVHTIAGHWYFYYSSVQFSRSIVSDSLQPHGPQHTRLPCPSPTPGVYPNSCPSSRWCYSIFSSSVIPFSFCPQSFPVSGSFQMSQFFTLGGQSVGVSASTSVLPIEHPGLISFRMGWLDLLAVQGTLKSLLQHHSSKQYLVS